MLSARLWEIMCDPQASLRQCLPWVRFTVMELRLRKISTFGDAIIHRGILKKAGTAKERREGRNFINKKATKGH